MKENLNLRVVEKDDLVFLHKMYNNPDIMDYWFEEAYQSMANLQETYDKNKDNDRNRLFMVEKEGVRLGMAALYSIDSVHRNAEYAIMIDPEHQGNGYAGPATKLAMDYGFCVLNLHKLYLVANAGNEKAIHIYEKAGFWKESVATEHYFVRGEYHDAVIMAAFQRDYLKKK